MNYLSETTASPLFVTSAFSDSPVVNISGKALDLSSLPRDLRVLLVTDGTVTKTLEAMFWESVTVSVIAQRQVNDEAFGELLKRDVKLIGESSQNEYVFARSFINTTKMPTEIIEQLKLGREGVGWLLRQFNREQYREIVDVGLASDLPASEIPEGFENSIYRVYCINVGGKRFMQITEFFPTDIYQQ